MNRTLAIVTVLSLFVAGVAVGALGMNLYSERHQARTARRFTLSPPSPATRTIPANRAKRPKPPTAGVGKAPAGTSADQTMV